MSYLQCQYKILNLLTILVLVLVTLYSLFGKPQQAFAVSTLEAFEIASDSYAREYCLNLEFGNSDLKSQRSALSEFYKIFDSFSNAPKFSSSLETREKILSKMMKQKKYKNVIAKKVKQICEYKEISLNFLERQKSYKRLSK